MTNSEKTAQLIANMGPFYVLTTDGDQPKGRPFSWFDFVDDKMWFGTGTFKEIYKQLQKNPKVEILAWRGPDFVRYDGTARFVEEGPLWEELHEQCSRDSRMPEYYEQHGYKMVFFTIDDGHVEIHRSLNLIEEYDV